MDRAASQAGLAMLADPHADPAPDCRSSTASVPTVGPLGAVPRRRRSVLAHRARRRRGGVLRLSKPWPRPTRPRPVAPPRDTPAFEPEEAFALAQRLEIHHTPKHGSWLNIAEIELSALTRQCLDRRIGDLAILNTELSAWQNATNTDQRQVDWQFTTHDARIKLRHLYPKH
ncbi:hypothetical protein SANTM175S_04977 [Streptomyces antimycoticus]